MEKKVTTPMCLTTTTTTTTTKKKKPQKTEQTFATHVLMEMLETVENIPKSCIIESGNWFSQYKSTQHFSNIQNICNKISVHIIRLLSVTGHD